MQCYKLILTLFISFLVGCAQSPQKIANYQQRIDELSLKLKSKNKELEQIKSQQLFYNKKAASPINERKSLQERMIAERKGFTEKDSYKEILSYYKKGNEASLEASVKKQIELFPQGQYSDNALYWLASHYYKNKNYAQALKYYEQLISQYSKSEKRGSGLLAKALTYQKLQLNTQAKSVLKTINKEYPKTPYARKARTLLKEL